MFAYKTKEARFYVRMVRANERIEFFKFYFRITYEKRWIQ